jgi:hypothetical protein
MHTSLRLKHILYFSAHFYRYVMFCKLCYDNYLHVKLQHCSCMLIHPFKTIVMNSFITPQ